jgi:photosystem II stability/assembly factor-like uncharacterized protein
MRCKLAGGLIAAVVIAGLGCAPASAAPKETTQAYAWSNAPMGGGGFVDGFVFHPAEKGLLYARTDIGGAYRWDPAGRRWTPLNDDLGRDDSQLAGVLSIALDPADPDRVYLAVGEYVADWAHTAAVLRSHDRGATWERTDLPIKLGGNQDGRGAGERLQVDPNDGQILFLGTTRDGLWRSADQGKTWRRVAGFTPAPATMVLFDARSGSRGAPTKTLYVGAGDPKQPGLWRSDDAGQTWQAVAGAPAGFIPHHAALDADGTLYVAFGNALGPNGVSDGGVWKYETASGRWRDITPVRPDAAVGKGFGYAGLSVDRRRPGVLVVSTLDRWNPGDDVFRSVDGGAHWTSLSAASRHLADAAPWVDVYTGGKDRMGHWIGDVEIDPFDSSVAIYGTGYGLWRTENLADADAGKPVEWRFDDQGLEETSVLDLASPPSGASLLAAMGDVSGMRWERFDGPSGSQVYRPATETNRSVDYAEQAPKIVVRTSDKAATAGYISADGGVNWSPLPSTPRVERGGDGRYQNAGRIAVSAKGGFLVWAPERQHAFASADHGRTWAEAKGWPEAKDATFAPVADRAVEGVFYVYDQVGGDLDISVDGGRSFQPIAHGLPAGGGLLRAVPGRARDLWLPTPAGLFHSASPADPFANLKTVNQAWAVGFGKAAPGAAYPAVFLWGSVRNVPGLYRSDDEGVSWVRIDDPHHRFGWLGALAGDPRVYGRVYLGANGRGAVIGDIAP